MKYLCSIYNGKKMDLSTVCCQLWCDKKATFLLTILTLLLFFDVVIGIPNIL